MRMLVGAVAAVWLAGCAPRLYVNVLHPAGVNLGSAKTLAVAVVEGRREWQQGLLQELATQAAGVGYFKVVTRNDAPAAGEVGLNIAIQEWGSTQVQDSKDPQWVGHVVLGLNVVSATGHPLAAGLRYKGSVTTGNAAEAIAASAHNAVAALLEELTPSFVQQVIRLDDEDPAQKPIIDTARSGDVKQAIVDERAVMANAPSASGAFNLAALLDSQGDYAEALKLYDDALKREPKDLYAEARAACARRLADTEALAH